MEKIWEVQIGNNFSKHTVKASNFIEAGRKALTLSKAVRAERFVSEVSLIAQVEA